MRFRVTRAVIVVGTIAAGCALTGVHLSGVRVGTPAPATEGVDADGQFFRLGDYPGRVVMISFWGNFCGPCRALFPHERAIVEKYRGKPFVLLGVNGDVEIEQMKEAQTSKGLTWRSWWDGPGGPICHQWGVQWFPTVVLIDHAGVVRYRSDGPPDAAELDARIEKLVREVPAEPKVG
jgi:thiol-disulfide isomerase/thioredoxin